MCGIMGFYCFGNKKPDKEKTTDMFSLLESRGRDACGYAFIEDNKNLFVHKAPIRSSEMIKTDEWKKLTLPKIMILHTRMKTQGCEKNNYNNHPLFSKDGIAIVHNGMVMNDKEIFTNKKRDGEVDSEAILAILSMRGRADSIKRVFDKIEGSFAVAIINKNTPEKLILIKKDNPVDLYYDDNADILYFCSERDIMKEALNIKSTSKRGFNLGEDMFHFFQMENNYALIINSDGVESYKKYHSGRRSYNRNWYGYPSLRNNTTIIECPFCMSQTSFDDSRLKNECEWCGMEITEEDIYCVI